MRIFLVTSFNEHAVESKPVISTNASVACFRDKCGEELTSTWNMYQLTLTVRHVQSFQQGVKYPINYASASNTTIEL